VACELSECCREEEGDFLEVLEEDGLEKCWKKVDAVDGRSSLQAGVAATMVFILLLIHPCSRVSGGRGQSAFLYGAKAGAGATAARDPK
jgi:hypothetical protein